MLESMKELICASIGQAGIQISNAIWELMCLEHGVYANGTSSLLEKSNKEINERIFCHVSDNQYTPRSLSMDLEPTVIDEIRTGIYRNLFSPLQLISGLEDSSCNFARGYYTVGKLYIDEFLESLRKLVQCCDSLQGFMIIHSTGGGCGSGFTSLAIEQMDFEYSKRSKMQFSILPSSTMTSAVVEPYNAIFSGKACTEATNLCLQHDNQSIFKLMENKLEITSPSFSNVNRLLAQIFSSLTVSIRFENELNNDIDQISINLIPYPRLHYLIDTYSPIYNMRKGIHYLTSTAQITRDVFDFQNRLLTYDHTGEKFLSCCLQYRGNVYPSEVNKAIIEIKKWESVVFVDWCPTGYKIGISRQPPISPRNSYFFDSEKNVLLLSNNTCFHQKIENLISKFDILFSKRTFVHWFVGEGMEEGEFVELREESVLLHDDYKCLAIDDVEIEENLDLSNEVNKGGKNKEISEKPSSKIDRNSYLNDKGDVQVKKEYNKAQLDDIESLELESSLQNTTKDKENSDNEIEKLKKLRKFMNSHESSRSDISTL